MSYMSYTRPTNLKPVLLNSELDEYSREYVPVNSKLKKFYGDVRGGLITTLLKTPVVGRKLNEILTNKASTSGLNRPYELSCKSDYTSYESLTDYSYYGRHIDPADQEWVDNLPPLDEVKPLFRRPKVGSDGGEQQTMCIRSTMLFPTFAQHLIDSFIVTAVKSDGGSGTEFEWKKTDSPHDIGLLPLYGRTFDQTKQLRVQNPPRGKYGQLKSQIIHGEEYAPYLYDADGKVKKEFDLLETPQGLERSLSMLSPEDAKAKKSNIFAFGGARTNLVPNITAWNTLLLREHNRIAQTIEKEEPTWDDERVFQTARNVLLVIYLKLVVEEYINHITGYGIDFTVDPGKWMWNAPWYKRNWISAEFAVLYRWHGVIPSCMKWGDKTLSTHESLFNNAVLTEDMKGSLRDTFINISNHRATQMNLFNTESMMVLRDMAALKQCRACKIKPYADYVVYLGTKERPTKFSDISKDKEVQEALEKVYKKVENVEFWTGLLASDNPPEGIMSPEMTTFVANDAFNQALCHPLLSENVWSQGEKVFGKYGWSLVQKKQKIADMVERNTKDGAPLEEFVGMTMPSTEGGINFPFLITGAVVVGGIAAIIGAVLKSN
mmetsp:Transcript_12119/g.18412  ORF Transcript_12119/g.18412 Transcript_12119/m.18412 type:complete len:606 (+) Transcript_12119:54-1871(+)